MGEMMSVQLMQRLRVELTSVALNEALVVGLLRHVPDVVEQVRLVSLQLLLLVNVIHGVQLLKFSYLVLENITCFQINVRSVTINQNILKHSNTTHFSEKEDTELWC